MPPKDIQTPEPQSPARTMTAVLQSLSQSYVEPGTGNLTRDERMQIAGDLNELWEGLGGKLKDKPSFQLIFKKFEPLVHDLTDIQGNPIINPDIVRMVYAQEKKTKGSARVSKKQRLILATGALGVIAVGAGAAILTQGQNHQNTEKPAPASSVNKTGLPSGASIVTTSTETPTVAPTKTSTSTPTKIPTIEPTATPESVDTFMEFLSPMIQSAQERRTERSKSDPEYTKRIDPELNSNRPLNIVIFGYGQTFEPPATEKAIIGSPTIISYNAKTKAFDQISLTHDIRAPEIEKFLQSKGQKTGPIRIDQAYRIGGFDLMRKTLESATGLSVDFEISFQDSMVKDLVDQVFQGLPLDIPFNIDTQPFYQDDQKYDAGHFVQGQKTLSGIEVMQFMKALPQNYDRKFERNERKYMVMKALLENLSSNKNKPSFILNTLTFLGKESIFSRRFDSDFDLRSLLDVAIKMAGKTSSSNAFSPKFDRSIYIVDTLSGDGGVQWVTSSININPESKHALDTGEYIDKAFEIPGDGNPHAENLITGYWKSLRNFVKHRLAENASPTPEAKAAVPTKEQRILFPAELSYPEVQEWIGKLRNSHDAVLSEVAFTKEVAILPAAKRQEILQVIAEAHAKALIEHYGNTDAIIGLDPGHGGSDVGSSGETPEGTVLVEKNLSWELSQLIADEIYQQSQGKYTVVMLRPENPNDEDLDEDGTISAIERLQKRKALLLKTEEKLRQNPTQLGKNIVYLSIHFNGSTDPTITGTETYWPNSVAMESDQYRESSQKLAKNLDQQIVAAIRQTGYQIVDRGAKEDPDSRQAAQNSETTIGPYIVLSSQKLDRNLTQGRKVANSGT